MEEFLFLKRVCKNMKFNVKGYAKGMLKESEAEMGVTN